MKISTQTSGVIGSLGAEAGYAAIAAAGFGGIDWNINAAVKPHLIRSFSYRGNTVFEKTPEDLIAWFAHEIECIRKAGLSFCQAHAPFPSWSVGHPESLDDLIGMDINAIYLCQHVGCPYLVVHGISMSKEDDSIDASTAAAMNERLFRGLIPTLKECPDVIVCMENLCCGNDNPWIGAGSDAHEAAELIDRLNEEAGREAFGFCLDTGHLHLIRGDFRHFVPILGNRLKVLHLQDNDGVSDRHELPTTGSVNWKHLINSLREIGYHGDLSFECYGMNRANPDINRDLLQARMTYTCEIGKEFRRQIQAE